MTAVLVSLMIFICPIPHVEASIHADDMDVHAPDMEQPSPQATVIAPSVSPTRLIKGQSTWYDYHEGQAAAGPRLRAALGRHWRGTKVYVCSGDVCIRDSKGKLAPITLSDWCACSPATRVIDLDVRDFAKLGSPNKGVLPVTVSPA